MADTASERLLSLDAYLRREAESDVKHEYVRGQVVALAGASRRHNGIVTNLVALLAPAARGGPCQVYAADVRLHAADDLVYYPDVMVVCDATDRDPLLARRPCLVVEVLSPSTEVIDRREKRLAYTRLPSLEAYLLLAHERRRAEVYRRDGEGWRHAVVGTSVALPCLDVELAIDDVYDGM